MLRKKLINLLRQNARLTDEQLAAMLDVTKDDISSEIENLENEGIIIGYSAVIDEEKFDKNSVTALIELKVTPHAENGYYDVAQKIAQYKEVETVRLMSGDYDLGVMIRGTNLREIGMFVSDRLAPMDGVSSTATHFVLQRFKEKGSVFAFGEEDERNLVSP